MVEMLQKINSAVWGIPTLLLILSVGLYFSIRTGFAQLRLFPNALKLFFKKLLPSNNKTDGISGYQALCTALAATVGTGNIAGVAGAIALGGPGSILWMWVCAFFGMIIKCAEATLAVQFRQKGEDGQLLGGPMYMIKNGLSSKWHFLATAYCIFGVIAALGVGNATQVNAVIGGIESAVSSFGGTVDTKGALLIGLIIAVLVGVIVIGGAKRIGSIAEYLVPIASVAYIILSIGVLILCADRVDDAFLSIIYGAFKPQAVTGGIIGSMFVAIRTGSARGVFTNEAGMGTAAIAHASAEVDHPAEQGMMGIMEVFIDTIVICTMTALVILCTDASIPYGVDIGVQLTTDAFSQVYGSWVNVLIALALICFAFATILGWGLYGLRCAQFLFGEKVRTLFVFCQVITVILGAVLKTGTVWLLAETVNGLMAIPNLFALLLLSKEFFRLMKQYKYTALGGTNENFNQCKPLRALSYEKVPSSCGSGGKAG